MEPAPSSGVGSGNSGTTYSPAEMADTLLFEEEIQSLVAAPPAAGTSFTALLGLPPSRAVELLHDSDPPPATTILSSPSAIADAWRFPLPPGCSPTFPTNAALVDRAARFSVFAAEEEPPPRKLKAEPADSGDRPLRLAGKRKEAGERTKAAVKKSKSAEENSTGGDEKQLPYVHVRARRGQATDSHSLAERARREKINARMKLLQELVPGCDKISGTALVLDEIINHVQSLQRQVEFLSMRLATVNPSIDFNGLHTLVSSEYVQLMAGSPWSDGTTKGDRHQQQQIWHIDQMQQQQQQQQWERDDTESQQQQQQHHVFMGQPGSSPFPNYDSTGSGVDDHDYSQEHGSGLTTYLFRGGLTF